MGHLLHSKEPLALVNHMELYFKERPPDCSLFSQENLEVKVHKEILYQTPYLCEMVKSVNVDLCCSKIEVLCPSIPFEKLEIMVQFFYTGNVACQDQEIGYQVSKNLTELFGFPSFDGKSQLPKRLEDLRNEKKSRKRSLATMFDDINEEVSVKEEIEDHHENDNMASDYGYDQEILTDTLKVDFKEEDYENGLPTKSLKTTNKKVGSAIEKRIKKKTCPICGKTIWENHMHTHIKTFHQRNCHRCYKLFETKDEVDTHFSSEHKREKRQPYLTCALCGNWKTAWKNLFQKHIITIHKDNTCCQTFEYTFDHIFENHAKYDCVICEEESTCFSQYEDLKDHMKSKHEKGYDCVGCQLFFPSKSELASHKETKHNHYKLLKITKGEEKHDCSICQAEYKSLAGLKHHISTVHENKGYFCPVCGKKFVQESTLNMHILTNCGKDTKENKCSMCHEKFESRSQRMEHIASHHKDVKLFDCDICEFKSMTKKSLREHVYGTHEHANICSLCGKNFATRCSLNNHMRYVHSGKKKSRANCTLCDASFSQPITLRHHMEQVHEGKKHQCSYCGEVFNTNHLLESHIAFNHDRSKLIECPVCKATFRWEKNMKDHLNFVHKKTGGHICPTCGKSFATKGEVRTHCKMVHEGIRHECNICNQTYVSKQALKEHIKKNHEGDKPSFKCSMCDKSFWTKQVLKRHNDNVHEKKRPFGCHLCGLSFAQSGQLKTHIKGKHKNVM